jgi:replicative DNA helicase
MDEFEQRLLDAECPSLHISGIDFDLDNSPLPCGFRDIEKHKYLRLGKPDLVVVAARPGVGKTALALQIASNVAERVGPTMFFSLEMDRRQLKQRLYALHSETSINKLHLLPQSRRERLTEKFINMPLYIDDTGGITINE